MSKAGKAAAFPIVEALTPQFHALVATIRETLSPEFGFTMMGSPEGGVQGNSVEFDGIRTRDGGTA